MRVGLIALFALTVDTVIADKPATLVLRGGNVVTLDDTRPTATALAATADHIVAVGSDAEITRWIGDATKVVDCRGRLVIPGFVEGHAHFVSLGESKLKLDLSTAASWDEVVAKVSATATTTPRGKWIVGRGWHQGKWKSPPKDNVEGYPDTRTLSEAVPDHPVLLTHGTGHMCLVNAKAMELAGITNETKPPRGGEILRDRDGRAIGVFREAAMGPLHRALERAERERSPQEVRDELLACVREASNECLRFGVTTFHDAGAPLSGDRPVPRTRRRGETARPVVGDAQRLTTTCSPTTWRSIGRSGFGNNHLTVRGIKRMVDGALGTHGAWLLEPYDDLPTQSRVEHVAAGFAAPDCRTGARARLSTVRARHWRPGESRNTQRDGGRPSARIPTERGLRWRIEHAQHLHPADIPAVPATGSDRLDARQSRHVRRAVRRAAARRVAVPHGSVCLAQSAGCEGRRHQRYRRAGGDAQPAGRLSFQRDAPHGERRRILSRTKHDPRRKRCGPTPETPPGLVSRKN